MRIVTTAMAIQFIDGKCHIKKRKSHKTTLSDYYACVSHDLLLMPSEVDTHTHAHIPTHEQKRFQETRHARPKATHAWFKKRHIPCLKKSWLY